MVKISVIIPVYNVEKYIQNCLISVINQTYKNLEIICLDDCSSDKSIDILQDFAQKDARIKIIKNIKNMGPGLTRNIGLEQATGDYIHFLDSDDWIELNAYEKLVSYINNFKSIDIINFGYKSIDETSGKINIYGKLPNEIKNKFVNFVEIPTAFEHWSPSAWLKLYKREFLIKKQIFFNDFYCFEDIEFSIQTFLDANKIYFIEDILLNYRANRKNSALNNCYKDYNNLVFLTNWVNNISSDMNKECQYAIKNYIYSYLIVNLLDAYYYNYISFDKMKEILEKFIEKESFYKNPYENNKYSYKIVERIWHNNSRNFFIFYKPRYFLKKFFPILVKIYLTLKRL